MLRQGSTEALLLSPVRNPIESALDPRASQRLVVDPIDANTGKVEDVKEGVGRVRTPERKKGQQARPRWGIARGDAATASFSTSPGAPGRLLGAHDERGGGAWRSSMDENDRSDWRDSTPCGRGVRWA